MTENQNLPEWNVSHDGGGTTVRAESAQAAAVRVAGDPNVAPTGELGGYSAFTSLTNGQDYYVAPVAAQPAEDEEAVPVVFAVHNGLVQDGQLMFANKYYAVGVSVIEKVQALLSPYEIV